MEMIVTGGTGVLGFALVRELAAFGHSVTVIVRPDSQRRSKIDGLPINIVNAFLDDHIALPEKKYDVFYHLAWEGGRNDFSQQYKNVDRTLNCLLAAKKYGCRRFVCTGSQAEYGEKDTEINEKTALEPTTSYGAAKAATYYLTRDLAKKVGIEHTWVRPFSVYGEQDNENTLFTQLCSALRAGKPFEMQTDGLHIWNFLHDTDAGRALRIIGENPDAVGVFDLSARESKPLCEYVKVLQSVLNPRCKISYGRQRSPVNLNAKSEKLRRLIGEYEKTVFPNIKAG